VVPENVGAFLTAEGFDVRTFKPDTWLCNAICSMHRHRGEDGSESFTVLAAVAPRSEVGKSFVRGTPINEQSDGDREVPTCLFAAWL
jgi:hypothetical protein